MKNIATLTGRLVQLSPREREVGRLLARGSTNKSIGYELHISPNTVKNVLFKMGSKLELSNRVRLASWILLNPESLAGLAVEPALVLPAGV